MSTQIEEARQRLNEVENEIRSLSKDLSNASSSNRRNDIVVHMSLLLTEREELTNKLKTMTGTGLGKDLKKLGRTIKKGFERKISRPIENAVEEVSEFGKAVIFGRNDYPPKVRDIISKYGNEVISKLTLMRTPVPEVLTGSLSLFSFGKFGKRLNRSFDELFHLFLEITTTSGKRLSIEKNEVINMDVNPAKRAKTETKNVINVPQHLTINDMLDNTKKYMGNKYFKYSAKSNNCQDFLVSLFKANGIGDQEDMKFIKQNTQQLFDDLPYLRKLSNTITDLGASINVLTTGKGIKKNQKNIMLDNIIMDEVRRDAGHICTICKQEIEGSKEADEMEGGAINIGRAFRKLGKDIKKGFKKEIERPVSKIVSKAKKLDAKEIADDVGKYVTKKKGGLASDVVKYGIPSVTAGIAGAAGSMAGPVSGVVASAIGKKLGDMAASEVAEKTGTGVRRGRFAKGSQEAKDYMKSLRDRRGKK